MTEPRQTQKITPFPRNRSGEVRLPTTSLQQRLWFIDQLESGSSAYHIAVGWRLEGPLDEANLKDSLNAILERHESLRTTFVTVEGELRQEVGPQGTFALRVVDLTGLVESDREHEVRLQKQEEVHTPFDLRSGPLLRGRLLRLNPREHVLLVTMHHIISDAWSISVLIAELSEGYAARIQGRCCLLDALPVQYGDYAQWQRQRLNGPGLAGQLRYWTTQLKDAPLQLELPTDRHRPAVQTYRGANVEIVLDKRLTGDLKAFASRHGLTLFMVLYAGWAAFLARISGQEDLVIGVPIANRQRSEVEGLIGLFVNALPLRIRLPMQLRVSELLEEVKRVTVQAYANQETPFEKIVEVVQPQRTLSRNPLFQVMLVLQSAPRSDLALPGLAARLEPGIDEPSMFDLELYLEELGEELVGTVNYSTDLFDGLTVKYWIESLIVLFRGLIQSPSLRLADLPIMSDSHKSIVLRSLSAEGQPVDDSLLHELIEVQARRAPAAIALIDGERTVTYRELNSRANQLARYLRARRIGADRLVGLFIDRGIDAVVAMVGVLKAGGAYLPLDPSYPPERVAYMLNTASPVCVLTQDAARDRLPARAVEIISLDGIGRDLEALCDDNLDLRASGLTACNLAYVIFTSGSTGEPKGVAAEHRNMVNRILAQQSFAPFSFDDVCCLKTSIGFVDAVFETLGPLAYGRTVVIVPNSAGKDTRALPSLIRQRGVTRLITVPSLARTLVDNDKAVACLQGLRGWTLSGEELTVSLLQDLQEKLPGCAFVNLYGASEVAADATCFLCQQVLDDRVPIGRPLHNTSVYVLDRALLPVPVGVVGEIYVGGVGVARGYLHRPELTAERFVYHALTGDPSKRLYRTGDFGRWRADGNLEFLGRNDDQVKLRGFRIELGEIEQHLMRHEKVNHAAVVLRLDAGGERRLVAYFTGAGEDPPGALELRTHLARALPEYMIPEAFVYLERLPLTPSGKTDRAALPAPNRDAYVDRGYEAPRGEVENVVARVWQALLGVPRIGRHDNFFELGGHSLLIVQMLDRLRRHGLIGDVRRAFVSASLTEFAGTLGSQIASHTHVPPNLIPPDCERITPNMLNLVQLEASDLERIMESVPGGAANVQDIYPLTPLQEGILFHHLLDGTGGDTYVVTTLLRLSSREQIEELVAALQSVIDRHDILRTAVLWRQLAQPMQVVYRNAILPVEEVTLDSQVEEAEQLKEWLRPDQQRLDLRKAPLMRLQVATTQAGRYALLQVHHIIDDAVSVSTVVSEVVAHLKGQAHELSQPAPYRAHVALALAYARSNDSAEFFRKKLGDVEEPTAPFGLLDVRGSGSRMDEAKDTLPSVLTERTRAQARRLGVSVATLAHVAFSLVVAATSARDDVVFGTVVLGRMQGGEASRNALGMLINTLPLRLQLQGMSVEALVTQTQLELAELMGHEYASLAVAQRCSGIPGSTPLFSALFNYRHGDSQLSARWEDAPGIHVVGGEYRTNYPISLSVDEADLEIHLTVQTDRRLDPQRVAAYMYTGWQSLIEALERSPAVPALALSILPDHERAQLLDVFNATHAGYPMERTIHELFEEQVRRTPHAIAVTDADRQLTYTQLNGLANQLAHYLIRKGVGPDRLVAVCMRRSGRVLMALLGILKAGGAYVPLDPNYPSDRLQMMMEDAGPRLVVTESGVLPESLRHLEAEPIPIDAAWSEITCEPDTNIPPGSIGLRSNHLGYVIYTSGSTGRPKGVAIEHRNTVNLLYWAQSALPRENYAHTLQSTSLNFDLSVYECFVPLAVGGTVHVVENALELVRFQNEVTLVNTVPSAISAVLDATSLSRTIRVVNLAGEALKEEVVKRTFANSKVERVCNLYGPSETTTYSTWISMSRERGFNPSVGRPIANTQIYILNPLRQLVPIGVVGEIYIGGAGVARGYLNRPQLTEERFVANPFRSEDGGALYKTSDLGRWLPDGTIEYLGRNDQQVKIRGFRIELGEIETRIARHPQVKEVTVVAREDSLGDKRLVAYVVPDRIRASDATASGDPEQLRGEIVSGWQSIWRETYNTRSAGPLAPNFIGWNSSYTGEPIPEREMREWLTLTVERIKALKPSRALEIGCGVGLLLQHLAPECAVYVGSDFSTSAIGRLQQWVGERPQFAHVELWHRSALELQDIVAESFDTVILNSVIQYFPDTTYFLAVLREALRVLTPGGQIFLGDIRHLGLLRTFHSAVQLSRVTANVQASTLRSRVLRAVSQEKELVFDPEFFDALPGRVPGISSARVMLKRGRFANELTRYRYDVVLTKGDAIQCDVDYEALEWAHSLDEIAAALQSKRRPAARVRGVANPRLAKDLAAHRLVESSEEHVDASTLRQRLADFSVEGADPEMFIGIGKKHGYGVQVCWDSQGPLGSFEVRFTDPARLRSGSTGSHKVTFLKPFGEYANDPAANTVIQKLLPQLRESLKEQLPEPMQPSAWVMLQELPRTPNGKLDRAALPAPGANVEDEGEYEAPTNDIERTLAEIWTEVLRVDQVGVRENFFELGGHSLSAMKVIGRIAERFDMDLSVITIFKCPTIQQMAEAIETSKPDLVDHIGAVERDLESGVI